MSSYHTGSGRHSTLYKLNRTKIAKVASMMLVFSFVMSPFANLPQAQASTTNATNSTELGGKALAPTKYKEPDAVTGALSYDFPLMVPPGRNGLSPELSLSYSSLPAEDAGVFGYGWSVSIPYIQRLNKDGSDELFNQFDFYSSLDGELKATTTSTSTEIYGALIESGNFLKYEYKSQTYWQVTDKSGTVYKFGYSSSTRQDNASNTAQVAKWMLEEVRDTNNNYIKYEYYKNGNQIYPSRIVYTGHDTTDGAFEIEFDRESRSDVIPSWSSGFKVQSNYRISEIRAEVSGTWVRKYELDYSTGNNGTRSVLTSITESGQDESSNVISLPATVFDYNESAKGWTEVPSLDLPILIHDNAFTNEDNGVRFADVNGDAWVDVIQAYSDSGRDINKTLINNGAGWGEVASWDAPLYFVASANDNHVRTADVNGDGLVDFTQAYALASSTVNRTFLNTGSGWSENATWDMPLSFAETYNADVGVRFTDVNGDGLMDVLQAYSDGTRDFNNTYINNGAGWTLDTSWNIPIDFVVNGADQNVRIEDVNNDGLPDLMQAYNTGSSVNRTFINTGTGWVEDPVWDSPEVFAESYASDVGVRLADINGDRLLDVVKNYQHISYAEVKTYLNNGAGWTHDSQWDAPVGFAFGAFNEYTQFVDVNGDSFLDIVKANMEPGTGLTTIQTHLSNGGQADFLEEIENSQGGATEFTYQASSYYKDQNGSSTNPRLPIVLDTVKTITLIDGLGGEHTTSYSYGGGFYYFGSSTDRQFGGFATSTKTDPEGNQVIVYYHQGNGTNSSNGEYSDHSSKIGHAYRTEIKDDSGNLFTRTTEKWDRYDLGNGRSFVKQANVLTQTYDGDSDHKDVAEEYTYNDVTGNLTSKIEWGEVTGSTDGTFSDTGSDKRTTAITYAASSTGYIPGLPSQETVTDQSSAKVKETKYYYDSQSTGVVTKGNLTKAEQWATSTTYIDIEKDYNTYGLITQERDPLDRVTSYSYDTHNTYVASSTNPLSQQTFFTYDYSAGKPKQVTDPNGRVFQTVFDAVDRVLEEKQPDIASPGSLVTKTAYVYTDTGMPRKVKKSNYLDGSTIADFYTYTDGFGRVVQSRVEAEGSNYAIRDFRYNSRGLLQEESQPYFGSGTVYTSATTNDNLWASYVYDAAGRQISATNAAGSSEKSYDDWKTTVTDANDNVKDYYLDAYGNLIKVTEHNDASAYDTLYTYDRAGNLTNITDALGNVRNFTYDGLGRRLTAQDLHDASDATYGTWTYVYDVAGNLGTTTDPKGQIVNYTYDSLNRILTENYTGATGTEITYGYDTCTEGKGRLCAATTTAAVTTYGYNALGGTASESKKIATTTYTTQFSYDRLGNQTLITYPDASEVEYEYNNAGLLESISRSEDGDLLSTSVVDDFDYAPHGRPSYAEYDNGVETVYTYDANTLYRLTNKTTTAGTGMGGSLEDLFLDVAEGLEISEEEENGVPDASEQEVLVPETLKAQVEDEAVEEAEPADQLEESSDNSVALDEISFPEENTTTSEEANATTGTQGEVIPDTATTTETIEIPEEEFVTTSEEVASAAIPFTPKELEFDTKESPAAPGQEVKELRDETSKTYLLEENDTEKVYATRLYQSPIHKKDAQGNYRDVKTSVTEMESIFSIDAGLYEAGIKKEFGENFIVFEGQKGSLTLSPENVLPAKVVAGEPEQTKAGVAIRYNDAYLDGSDVEVVVGDEYLRKDVILEQAPLVTPLDESSAVEYTFKLGGSLVVDVEVDGRHLSEEKVIESDQLATVITDSHEQFYIWPPRAEDSRPVVEPGQYMPIKVRYELREDGVYLTKLIPYTWLSEAEYPVRADVTLSTSVGYGDGAVESQPYPADWSVQHADTTGRLAVYTGIYAYAMSAFLYQYDWVNIKRAFIPIDTSSIPDNAVITAATLNLYVPDIYDDYNDAESYINVYQGFQSSPTAVINSDFDNCGDAETNPTKGSANIDTTFTDDAYTSIALNATGTAWISKTGYTQLCLREGHDTTNTPHYGDGAPWNHSGIVFATYETEGTSTDPYFEVVYTIPNATPTVPSDLQAEGETNPSNVIDSTPEFSAIYNDTDDNDIATAYQIQVATTSGSWSSLVWDSGKEHLFGSTTSYYLYSDALATGWWDGSWEGGSNYSHSTTVYSGTSAIQYRYDDTWSGLGIKANVSNPNGVDTGPYSVLKFAINKGTSTSPNLYLSLYGPGYALAGSEPLIDYVSGGVLATSTWYEVTVPLSDFSLSDTDFTYFTIESATAGPTIYVDEVRVEGITAIPGEGTLEGERSPEIVYGGIPLDFDGTSYYWRIKFWDDEDSEGAWSTSTSTFEMNDLAGATILQNLSYLYDAVGNITRITDDSDTTSNQIVNYTYDDLYRLTEAAGSNASGTPQYTEAYAYNALGNILSKNDIGAYSYTGTSTSNYANPHAVTVIATSSGTTTLAYDANGNVTQEVGPVVTGGLSSYFYSEGTAYGWWSGSWGGTVNFNNSSTSSVGSLSASHTYTTAWGGFGIDPNTGIYPNGVDSHPYSVVKFWINRGTSSPTNLHVKLYGGPSDAQLGTKPVTNYIPGGVMATSTWYEVTVPLSDLNANDINITSFVVQNGNTGTIYFDEIRMESQTGGTTTHAWTYDNRLASTTNLTGVTYYQYDHTGQRVTLKDSTGTTTTANQFYSVSGATSTKHIYGNGELVATVEGTGDDAVIHYVHTDHLGGTNVVSTNAGTLEQVIDYYPFGSPRTNDSVTEFDERKKFTGHEFDNDTSLYYMKARYQSPEIGRFVSQDPAFAAIGDPSFESRFGRSVAMHLSNPQNLNSYSYVSNNPLIYHDPKGEIGWVGAAIGGVVGGVFGGATAIATGQSITWGVAKGAAAGGAAGFTGAYIPALLAGAGAGGFVSALEDVSTDGSVNPGGVAQDMIIGSLSTTVGVPFQMLKVSGLLGKTLLQFQSAFTGESVGFGATVIMDANTPKQSKPCLNCTPKPATISAPASSQNNQSTNQSSTSAPKNNSNGKVVVPIDQRIPINEWNGNLSDWKYSHK